MADFIDAVFGPSGLLAGRFPGYQPRAGQVALARAVEAAIASGKALIGTGRGNHLLAECPTGTGKSIGYAVPVVHHAVQARRASVAVHGREVPAPVVLVTANIALQEQLVKKDLPLLREILPEPFTYVLLKGISNYLCLDRVHNGVKGEVKAVDRELNDQIAEWAERTTTGDVSELPFEPPPELWRRFSVSKDECVGSKCQFAMDCYGLGARRQARLSDIVVTNYHLLFADMKVREATNGKVSLLPNYSVAVLDEGHKAVDTARDFFGFRISRAMTERLRSDLPQAEQIDFQRAEQEFFSSLLKYKQSTAYKKRIRHPNVVDAVPMLEVLKQAAATYASIFEALGNPDTMTQAELKFAKKIAKKCTRAIELRSQINSAMRLYGLPRRPWCPHPNVPIGETPQTRWYWSNPIQGGDNSIKSEAQLEVGDPVFFIEEEDSEAVLCSRSVNVASILRDKLFNANSSVSVTSATLVAKGSFDYLATELGVPHPTTLVAQSPFTWHEQALLVLPTDVPDPNDQSFTAAASERCVQVIELARGRTLALFTSKKNMNAAYEHARKKTSYRVLRQGDMPRTKLIDEFRRDTNSVLFGVESFWAGVDVPGESLSCVFIDRLPFVTPEDPVMDVLTERDKDWFMKYSVPKAIIAFKQGFGRLIRTTTDRGVVVVLDRRVSTKFYGKLFVSALPPVQQSNNLEDVRRFLDREPIVGVGPAISTYVPSPGRSLFDALV